jgi:hypothetical protein
MCLLSYFISINILVGIRDNQKETCDADDKHIRHKKNSNQWE